MENLKRLVSQQIKDARTKEGLTQKELGGRIGVTESAVARYESGNLNMSTEVLFKIADAMGMDIAISLTKR